MEGNIKKGQKIRFMNAGVTQTVENVGVFTPKKVNVGDTLGQVKWASSNRHQAGGRM
jgi:translation elongation factor EF-4